jgi:pimeloyl-ACP methyl ester carboxylesterase
MKKRFWTAAALALIASGTAHAEDAAGDWAGVLLGQLHLVVHLTRGADGRLTGMMESLDQGDAKIPIGTVDATADRLKFTVPAVKGAYDGSWDGAKAQWTGTWTQGQSLELDLHRATATDITARSTPPKRPQEDAIAKGPRPYSDEPVTFANAAAGVTLSGTFSKPSGSKPFGSKPSGSTPSGSTPSGTGPFPTVVLIAGSGPQDRDEDVLGHKIFLVLADALNRRGIAVLRYDKRGIGGSTGHYDAATSADFISDAEAAVAYLKTRTDVDTRRIGLLGHSEGGLIAPAVAVADPSVAFVVLMAGPGVRGDRVLMTQTEAIARAKGAAEADIARTQAVRSQAFAMIEASSTATDARARLTAAAAPAIAAGQLKPEAADQGIAQMTSPWMYSFLRYDPAPVLQKVRVPVLALGGSLDLQVEPKENLTAIRAALKDDADVTVTELPGLNHLFQDATTGSPNEYGAIAETLAPIALKTIGDWVMAHATAKID